MASNTTQGELFQPGQVTRGVDGTVLINERCSIQSRAGYHVVTVCGLVLAHYATGDRMGQAHAIVSLVEQGWAKQTEVASAFGCDPRTVRRNLRRFESGGLAALGRGSGYPKGAARLPVSRSQLVDKWKADGAANREIARRLGISDMAVRKLLLRLGWKPHQKAAQLSLDMGPEGANPNLSGSGILPVDSLPLSLDTDPLDRSVDRVLACLGLLDDAAPLFAPATDVPGAGALLAIPVLVQSGVFEIAEEVYGSIGPAFYGLRTTFVALLLMALLRIKRPESLKEHSPRALGRLLGLDRAPEVKTLRRKLARLAAFGRGADLGRAMAQRRVASRGYAMGFLYVDGHVRAYHGKRALPKTHLARMRLAMPATTDYWVNDMQGEPLFVVTTEANKGLVKMLPVVLEEVRALVGDRRVTVVFDRGGWSPKLFAQIIASGFDILTYRKGPCPAVRTSCFCTHEAVLEGRKLRYVLADTGTYIEHGPRNTRKRLHLRQVTRLNDNGYQTPVITSRRDLPAIEIAYRMFERWRQENFFKYLRQEYALDALVDYGVEPADATRDVPNPRRKELNAELRKAYGELNLLAAEYGAAAFVNLESARRTMRGFKIAHAPLGRRMHDAIERVAALEKKRAAVPARIPVQQLTEDQVVKLRVERKHITDLLKMVAYQAESDLLRLVCSHYRRTEDEGRTLIQSVLASAGDLAVTADELGVALAPLSSPHKTHALVALCGHLNDSKTLFPGSKLRLRFEVKLPPETSLAFPGPRPSGPADGPQPDISVQG